MKTWIVTDYCKDNLKQHGFVYDMDLECWKLIFPVRFWKRNPTLYCRVYLSRDKECTSINIVDAFDQLYPAFYYSEYGKYGDFIQTAKKKILYKLNSIGIKEKKIKIKEKKKHASNRKKYGSKSKVSRRRH